MTRSLLAALGLCFCAISGCGGGPSNGDIEAANDATISGVHVEWEKGYRGDPPPLTALDREAATKAIELWKPTKVGESLFVCEVLPLPLGSALGSQELDWSKLKKTLYEMREATVVLPRQHISEADKLNGLQWRGRILLWGKVVRARCFMSLRPQEEPDKTWGKWQDGFIVSSVDCECRNGVWNVKVPEQLNHGFSFYSTVHGVKYEKIDPSNVPR